MYIAKEMNSISDVAFMNVCMCAARLYTVFKILYCFKLCIYDGTLQMLFACACVHMYVAIVQYAHNAVYVCMCVYSMLDECSTNA